MMDYLRRSAGRIPVWRYHIEKAGHSLLIGAALAACGICPFIAVTLAVVGYLLVGKALVRSAPSGDWLADFIIGSLAIIAERFYAGDPFAYAASIVWAFAYWFVVLKLKWAHP